MSPIEEAILRTVIYADIFNFPLTRPELHHYLICSQPITLRQIEQTLATSSLLQRELQIQPDYVAYRGNQAAIDVRRQRAQSSLLLWPFALQYGQWLSRLPFVHMVALTGALAVRNASDDDDDLDYVLVTAAGRVWLARAFAIVLVRLAKTRGIIVCPNYVLAESALEQDKRDLFMAHEVAQMVPVYGFSLYRAMRDCNPWVEDYLPNANAAFYDEQERQPGSGWNWLKRTTEWALGGKLGDTLENWEYRRKLRRFASDMHTPHSAALLDNQHVKGHFNDHGYPVLQKYADRLRQYDLEALPLAGD